MVKSLGLVLLVLIVVLGAAAAAQLLRGVPPAQASVVLPGKMAVPGTPAPMPWPTQAAAAVAIEGIGDLGGVRAEEVRPLASVTKLLTALVVLKRHPLQVGQAGPTITITAAQAALYPQDVAEDQSVVKVAAGEHLSELQALEAMLVPSADNMANILAQWCAGTVPPFVQALNAEAGGLGLAHTHLADPSGYDSASVGTAADMVRVGEVVMESPVLRKIVDMPQVTLPVAGTVYNYDTVLGQDGIIGIKTGSDTAAGGNFVFAAKREEDGRTFTVVGAVLGGSGQQPLRSALDDAKQLANAALDQVELVRVLPAGRRVLEVKTKWGATDEAVTTKAATLFAIPGEALSVHVSRSAVLRAGKLTKVSAGERLATVQLGAGQQEVTVPVDASATLPAAPVSYRLFRL